MATLTRRACAKINLTLDVFSKRADGFHSIASVMQSIGLYDTLTLERTPGQGVRFSCTAPNAPDVPEDDTNLVVRAARAVLQVATGNADRSGVAIHLDKRIPSQAGLGGGSSDAAATLIAVNELLDLGLQQATLLELAAQLGADVSFFLLGGAAVARGRGETLTALPDIPQLWLVVVKPEENVSTGWAYNELDSIANRQSHRGTRRLEEALRAGDAGRIISFQCNDFELPIFDHFPKLAWLHDELRMAGALVAHLCGSGSALYGVAPDQAAAGRIATLLRARYAHVFIAPTLTRAESLPEKDPS